MGEGNIQLGAKIENPYSLTNMRKAYLELASSGSLKSASTDTSVIQPTHLYVRFLPKDTLEYDILKSDTTLVLFGYPLDCELSEGVNYHDSTLPANQITWQYTKVPVGYVFGSIAYEIIEELYMPFELEEGQLKSATNLNWEELLNVSMRLTGNLDKEMQNQSGELTLKGLFPAKWNPSATIKVWDDATQKMIPVIGAKVRARHLLHWASGITNEAGYVSMESFRYDVNYSIVWEREYWDIRDGNWGQAYYNGPNSKKGTWDLEISSDKSLRYATIHQAAFDYYYRNPFGIQIPFDSKWYQSALKIGYHDEYNDEVAADFAKWRNWFTWPHIRVYKGQSTEANTTKIYATTIHELAHSAHWQLIVNAPGSNRNEDFNCAETKLVESWARGVQRAFTRYYRDSSYEPGYDATYTHIVRYLISVGYKLSELEDALVGASTMAEWKTNMTIKMKTNWIISFHFISILAILNSGCAKIDRTYSVEYRYINHTNNVLSMTFYGNILNTETASVTNTVITHSLEPNDSFSIILNDMSTTEKKVADYPSGLIVDNQLLGDSLSVVYGNESIFYFPDIENKNQLYKEQYYKYERIDNRSFRYIYSFE
jgi:hypothetical protein